MMKNNVISFLIISCISLVLGGCMSPYPDYSMMDSNTLNANKASKPEPPKRTYSFPNKIKAPGRKQFIYDPKHLMWAAYSADGYLVSQGAGSGGRGYCSDVKRACKTPVGNFRVTRKQGAGCKSSKYPIGKGGAPMPHCMHFYKGYAIHGSPDVPNYNASHGCIRVQPADAAWLSNNFMEVGTKVKVLPY